MERHFTFGDFSAWTGDIVGLDNAIDRNYWRRAPLLPQSLLDLQDGGALRLQLADDGQRSLDTLLRRCPADLAADGEDRLLLRLLADVDVVGVDDRGVGSKD